MEDKRLFHSLLNDSAIKQAKHIVHGVGSRESSEEIRKLIRPNEASAMASLLQKFKERVYISSTRKRLGQTPVPHLSSSIDPHKTKFGIKNVPGEGASPLINPRLSGAENVNNELADHEHYHVSHKHLSPGEQIRRRYENFDCHQTFGVPTHCDPRGIYMKRTLSWGSNAQDLTRTSTISSRQFDFKEKYDHKLGKTRKPIMKNMAVRGDHTFGLPSKQGDLTVAELIGGTIPRHLVGLPSGEVATEIRTISGKNCVNWQQRVKCLMPTVHHALRNASFSRGSDITAVLCHLSNGGDLISAVDARQLLLHFEVPVDEELTEQIFDLVMVESPEEITKQSIEKAKKSKPENELISRMRNDEDAFQWAVDWRLLAAFLDWKRNPIEKDKLRKCGCQENLHVKSDQNEVAEAVKTRIRRAIDANLKTYTLSSEQYSGDLGGLLKQECWARLGTQAVNRRLHVPKVKRCHDDTDYGDEATIRSPMHPSIYTEYGLSARDLLIPRTKEEIRSIMDSCDLTEKYNLEVEFDQIWGKALELDKAMANGALSGDDSRTSLHVFKDALLEDLGKKIRKNTDIYYINKCY